ncbi:hypothetical protein PUNSTDRAFT_127011 [Punctularia strigosozonata HHB-11173 SS5]|uniref:uncharacterized protein n=1 Tax=Punctularia strigosozonata (strain HHB-11173) TaxID=741275 RepID=UPI00044174A3|nr:uncharacterized protein PUNSTDRAFT_127011 [Punctularia strigosozonata HHB-11173 SS5]EIN07215.1 hypothetical protein PUNSTDRAFT_127011 [Punctularia strigosozonata HHB-11173 SS5]
MALGLRLPSSPRPFSPRNFAALSPIYFLDQQSLIRFLEKITAKNFNKSARLTQSDTSRARFEISRTFLLHLDNSVSGKDFALRLVNLDKLRVVPLAVNLASIDPRSGSERERDPIILDVGVGEARCCGEYFRMVSRFHLKIKEKLIVEPRTRKPFEHGHSEELEQVAAGERLRELLADGDPLVLLVYNRSRTLSILRALGIDHFDGKVYNMEDLYSPESERSTFAPRKPRSRSPQRRASAHYADQLSLDRKRDYDDRQMGRKDFADDRGRTAPPKDAADARPISRQVYILDIQEMYNTMLSSSDIHSLSQVALELGVIDTDPGGICAGNEVQWLLDMWISMSKGGSILQQREARESERLQKQWQTQQAKAEASTPTPIKQEQPISGEDSDEDLVSDPNDALVEAAGGTTNITLGKGRNPYDENDDENDDSETEDYVPYIQARAAR